MARTDTDLGYVQGALVVLVNGLCHFVSDCAISSLLRAPSG